VKNVCIQVSIHIVLIALSKPQMMDIADTAIKVGGAREGQSFVLKV
jgi:hypothetical protein